MCVHSALSLLNSHLYGRHCVTDDIHQIWRASLQGSTAVGTQPGARWRVLLAAYAL